MNLKWTDKLPMEPGWYWCKWRHRTINGFDKIITQCIKIVRDRGDLVVTINGNDEEWSLEIWLDYNVLGWAGPIPEPTEQ